MNNQGNHYIIVLLIVIACALASPSFADALNEKKLAIEFNMTYNKISLNEPILINLVIKNHHSEPVEFNLGSDGVGSFEFSIHKQGSPSAKHYKYPSPWGTSRTGLRQLAPGEIYTDTLIVNKWFSADTPGLYKITPQIVAPLSTTLSNKNQLTKATIQLQITPRNAERLKRRADE